MNINVKKDISKLIEFHTYKEQEKQVSVSESKETAKVTNSECEKTIKEFLEKCTAGNYENAYVYLSDKCKQENYPTLDDFINNYCISNSIKGKDFSIKKQADNPKLTYMIKLNNMLSSGKIITQLIYKIIKI